jgi:hypothetical protein
MKEEIKKDKGKGLEGGVCKKMKDHNELVVYTLIYGDIE